MFVLVLMVFIGLAHINGGVARTNVFEVSGFWRGAEILALHPYVAWMTLCGRNGCVTDWTVRLKNCSGQWRSHSIFVFCSVAH